MTADFGMRSADWVTVGLLVFFAVNFSAAILYLIVEHVVAERAWRRRLAEMNRLPPKRTVPRWMLSISRDAARGPRPEKG